MRSESASFVVNCHHCQARLKVREEDLGQERTCPRCQYRFLLPTLEEANRLQRVQHAKAEYSFRCRLCGTLMYAHRSQQGEPMPCPDCHSSNTVPTPSQPVARQPEVVEDAETYRLQDEHDAPTTIGDASKRVRVRCHVCDAMMYARTDQIGKLIPCVDCGTAVRVRQPPPEARRPVLTADAAIDIQPTFEREAAAQSHEKTWAAASQWADQHRAKSPTPPKRPFLDGTYTFPLYREMLPRWLGLTVLWLPIVPFCILVNEAQTPPEKIVLIPLFLLLTPLLIILIFFIASMLMAVVARTAVGYDHVDEWPRLDIFERVLNLLFPTSAFIMTTAPWGLLHLVSVPWWVLSLVQIVSAYCFFPVVFLSLCENNSVAVPYHRAIWQSLRQQSPAWRHFYLAAAPAFMPLCAWVAFALFWPNPWIVAMTFTFWLVAMLTYFRFIGRLAWQLSRHLPIEGDVA